MHWLFKAGHSLINHISHISNIRIMRNKLNISQNEIIEKLLKRFSLSS